MLHSNDWFGFVDFSPTMAASDSEAMNRVIGESSVNSISSPSWSNHQLLWIHSSGTNSLETTKELYPSFMKLCELRRFEAVSWESSPSFGTARSSGFERNDKANPMCLFFRVTSRKIESQAETLGPFISQFSFDHRNWDCLLDLGEMV